MNNDLISRCALLEKSFLTEPATMINPYGGENVVRVEDIENAPSVDAVVPVRCKDCKHGRKSDHAYAVDTAKPLCECNFMYGPHQWHEYCSWGERRADDE